MSKTFIFEHKTLAFITKCQVYVYYCDFFVLAHRQSQRQNYGAAIIICIYSDVSKIYWSNDKYIHGRTTLRGYIFSPLPYYFILLIQYMVITHLSVKC